MLCITLVGWKKDAEIVCLKLNKERLKEETNTDKQLKYAMKASE